MRDVTLLWALRSPCNLGCRYCYFGTIEQDRVTPPTLPGQLSHLARDDLGLDELTAFLATIGDSAVRRVFLAGGEPLIWPHTLTVIETLRTAGVQVVVCTNGIPLNRPEITERIVELGVDAVSVSLDAADPDSNDRYRPARNGSDGWVDVVSGIRRLLATRGSRPAPRVGLYKVITRDDLGSMREVADLGADLGVDYYVPQPISLAPDHPLHDELTLRQHDGPALATALNDLYRAGLAVDLPAPSYPEQMLGTVISSAPAPVGGCFGGHTLFFIEPDGSVWDCPSRYKIAATAPARRRTIRGSHASELFGTGRGTGPADCALFSGDCVNMWPLMGFDRFLPADAAGGTA
jgi:MoaA/NifB/PqqE/SkfB family radical SAM enzyme